MRYNEKGNLWLNETSYINNLYNNVYNINSFTYPLLGPKNANYYKTVETKSRTFETNVLSLRFSGPKNEMRMLFFFRKTKHGCLNIVLMAVCNTWGESFNKWFIKKFQIKRSIKKTLIIFILLCSSLYWVCQKNDNLQYTYHFPYLKTAWYGVMYNIYNS